MRSMVLFGLSLAGLLISVYFTLVSLKLIRPDTKWIPRVCRLDERSCGSILETREARIFGIPNYVLGMIYYCGMLVLSLVPWVLADVLLELQIVSAFTVFVGFVLTHSLIWKIKVRCVLCFTSHAINAAIMIMIFTWP